jgi:anaerobic selenocysteine-containing dehydrogenase
MVDYHPLKRFPGTRRPHDRALVTVCQECSVGCGLVAYSAEDGIVDVHGDETDPISRGRLCGRGTSFARRLYSADRVRRPMTRARLTEPFSEGDDWNTVLDLLSDRLKKIRDQHGPESLLIACDTRMGPDFYYGGTRFAALWGTPYVFESFQSAACAKADMPNAPERTCCDWANSSCLFLVGADPATTHPVYAQWILKAQSRGALLVVADTRFTATMSKADVCLLIRPDSENTLGMALMQIMLDNDWHAASEVAKRFSNASAWRDSVERMPLPDTAEQIGVSVEDIQKVAHILAKRGPAQLITPQTLSHQPGYGIWRTMAVAMGWTKAPGAGWYPLDSGRPALDATADLEGRIWRNKLADAPNPRAELNRLLGQESAEIEPSVKAAIFSGDSFADFLPNRLQAHATFLLAACFGCSMSQAGNFSQFLLPASLWPEKDGLVFTNDRGMRWTSKVADPPDGTRSGLDFWTGLAERFGWREHFPWIAANGSVDHRAFYEWLLAGNPSTAGCLPDLWKSPEGNGASVYWPMPGLGSTTMEPTEPLTAYGEAGSSVAEDMESYPLRIESPRTGGHCVDPGDLWPWVLERDRPPLLQIHPDVARALHIENGDAITALAPGWNLHARAWVNRAVPRHVVYSTQAVGTKQVLIHRSGREGREAIQVLKGLLR